MSSETGKEGYIRHNTSDECRLKKKKELGRLNRTFSFTWPASTHNCTKTKEKKFKNEKNSTPVGLACKHGRCYIVLEHQHGRRYVM